MHRATCTVCDHHEAPHGHLICPLCLDELRDHLGYLAAGYPRLDPTPGSAPMQAGPRASGFESASPARDDVLVLTDRRRVAYAPDTDQTRAQSVYGLVRHLHEEAAAVDLVPPATTTVQRLLDLRNAAPGLARQWWVAQLHAEIERAAGWVRRALGEEERYITLGECPRPTPDLPDAHDLYDAAVDDLGEILAAQARDDSGAPLYPHCGGRIRSRGWGSAAACQRCRRRWRTVDELRELGAMLGGAMLDMPGLARYLDMTDRQATLRKWASRDRWRREKHGTRTVYSLDDALGSWWAAWDRANPVHGPELPPPPPAAAAAVVLLFPVAVPVDEPELLAA